MSFTVTHNPELEGLDAFIVIDNETGLHPWKCTNINCCLFRSGEDEYTVWYDNEFISVASWREGYNLVRELGAIRSN